MEAFGVVLGLALPIAFAWASVKPLAGADAVGVVALLAFSAALNSFRPLGGGMAVDGTYCTRLGSRDWVFDARRSPREKFLGPFTMTIASFGCFFLALPVLAALWRMAEPSGLARELAAIAGLLLVVIVGFARYKPELPLWKWREALEKGEPVAAEEWRKRIAALSKIARADGSIGHVGGVGAGVVGLHEHLDAVEILQWAVAENVEGAPPLLEKALAHLQTRRVEGGFAVYPGGQARGGFSERAERALGARR